MAICGATLECNACYMAQDANLLATCANGRCAIVDLLADAMTACSTVHCGSVSRAELRRQ